MTEQPRLTDAARAAIEAAGKPAEPTKRDVTAPSVRQYDAVLGAINDEDRENAADLLSDIEECDPADNRERTRIVAEWFRKVRYEAVMAERQRLVSAITR